MARERLKTNYGPLSRGDQSPFKRDSEDDSAIELSVFDKVAKIQTGIDEYKGLIGSIEKLHATKLNSFSQNDGASRALEQQLDLAHKKGQALTTQIQAFRKEHFDAAQSAMHNQQVGLLSKNFKDALLHFQTVEKSAKVQQESQFNRQIKIAFPDGTPDDAMLRNPDVSVFDQALRGSRVTQGSEAYKEVTSRREEMERIEKTLAQLAQLFVDLNVMLEEQDETIKEVEIGVGKVEDDAEVGLGFVNKAIINARSARKMRWICFLITLVVLIIVGVVIGCEVSGQCTAKNNSSGSGKQ